MSKNINIKSNEWCDLIFKNRNKTYGAYKMRQSSSRDHLIAFGVTIVFTAILSIFSFTFKSEIEYAYSGGCTFGFGEETVEVPILPAPPKMWSDKLIFPEPKITPDNKVIKVVGDDKNGVLYEEGEYSDTAIDCIKDSVVMIDLVELIQRSPVVIEDFDNRHGDPYPIEVPPVFPGGDNELYKYLERNLRYPSDALEMGIEGRVVISFTVSKTGKITNLIVLRSLHYTCDKEAMRLVGKMPNWIPGMVAGQRIDVSYILPVCFRLI